MIEQALLQIREDMARLRAAMRAKGHVKAIAEFQIEDGGHLCIHLDTEESGQIGEAAFRIGRWNRASSYAFPKALTYPEVLSQARELVEQMLPSAAVARAAEAQACAAWFDVTQSEAAPAGDAGCAPAE